MNGVWDEGEPGLEGWLIKLLDASGTYLIDSTFTDPTGHYCFYNLAPDTYRVREIIPPPPPIWAPTTPTEYKVAVESGGQVTGVDFGNVWLAPIGARTIGYWRNHPEAITEEMYAELSQLPAFIGVDTFEEVYEILSPPWHSMAEKLRAQLLAMTLNVLSGYVPGDAMVYLGWDVLAATLLFGEPPPMGATAQQILDAVEANHDWTHWNKDEQEAVKDLLDAMNNDERFISPVPPVTGRGPACGGTKGTGPRSYLLQNHPNPFTSATTISYHLPAAGWVSLKVYDNSGRLARTLVNGIEQRGLTTVEWNGRDNDGREVASGIYFYRLISSDSGQTRKMIVIR